VHKLFWTVNEGNAMAYMDRQTDATVERSQVNPELSPQPERTVEQTMNIKGGVALVTGAAGGIGRALALELVKRKVAGLALVDQSDAVQQVAKAMNELAGGTLAYGYSGDVTDADFRRGVYAEMAARRARVNICVPAAGVTRDGLAVKVDKQTKQVAMYPVETFRQVVEINLVSPVYWAMEMVAGIAQHRARQGLMRWEPTEPLQGAVIFIGSVSSLGNKGQIAYASTKAGLEGAAATLMMEAVFHGVRCSVIHPGFTDTPMVRALGEKFIQESIIPRTQLRRLIQPEEIADAICFMISNAAVSGSLWADAGWHPGA
jgi:NAD(P)-dependent dehydrogenase (short-subunit alcohol dehydrogenase family)